MASTGIRGSYTVIRDKYQKIGKGKVRLTQSSLRLQQPIDPNLNVYTFKVLENENTPLPPLPTEIRLSINDEFVSYNVGYYVGTDITVATAPTFVIGEELWTYAPMELNTTFSLLSRAWNSQMAIQVNKISRLEKWDMMKHRIVPRTQYQNSQPGQPFSTQPSTNFHRDGMADMQPMLTLSGAKKNDITITLLGGSIPFPQTGVWVCPSSAVGLTFAIARLELFFRGMLAQNAASFQK